MEQLRFDLHGRLLDMSKTEKFDSVKMMRDIRDKISKDVEGMTLEDERKYLQKMISSSK